MAFYHATTRDRIESIQKHGLGGLPGVSKAFPSSPDGVYLAEHPMLALGFLIERALAGDFSTTSPMEALNSFCVFVIDEGRVEQRLLSPDPNLHRDGFWLYGGVIDVTAMPILSAEMVTSAHFDSGAPHRRQSSPFSLSSGFSRSGRDEL